MFDTDFHIAVTVSHTAILTFISIFSLLLTKTPFSRFFAFIKSRIQGTIVGDPEECAAIDTIFCKNRTKPLLVGSVKSNIGHSESTAGVCSITKCILAFETGLIAPNINFTRIRPGIPSLEEGRLTVCTDVTKLDGMSLNIS